MLSTGIIQQHEWRWITVFSVILLLIVIIPFIIIYGIAGADHYFMGVLLAPVDGMSYLAKIDQGVDGSWLFTLPYTPEEHNGVFLFTFYLAMGHLSRMLNLPGVLVFHIVRIIGAAFMFLAYYRFVADWTDDVGQRRFTWAIGVLGAGFGWVALALGHSGPWDILILAEAFPLQAAFANAHFPWAIAIALNFAHVLSRHLFDTDIMDYPELSFDTLTLAVSSLVLISISPFALFPLAAGAGVHLLWKFWRNRAWPRREFAWLSIPLLFGTPLFLYNLWATSSANPVLQAWMAQNITLSPPVWDYFIAYGMLLVFAAVGIYASSKNLQEGDVFLLGWLLSAVVMLYFPLNLQRRFSIAIMPPLVVYAGRAVWRIIIPTITKKRRSLTIVAVFCLVMPSTLISVFAPIAGSKVFLNGSGGYYFVTTDEHEALTWLGSQKGHPLSLASPEFGTFLPVYGMRVVYGHLYETLKEPQRKSSVTAFYTGEDCSVIEDEGVDMVIVGPRERLMAGEGRMCDIPGELVFTSAGGSVEIYDVTGQ